MAADHPHVAREPISAELIAQRGFSVARRGFDQGEVKDFLARVSAEVRALRHEIERLDTARREAEERAATASAPPPVKLDEDALMAAVGDETAAILRAARGAAADVRRRGDEEAAAVLTAAQAEAAEMLGHAETALSRATAEAEAAAERIRQDARRDADEVVERAQREAEATRQAAEQERKLTVEGAQSTREKILADLSRRRRTAAVQIEQLRAGRERLLESYGVVRRTLEEVNEELQRADAEARAAADDAGHRAEREFREGVEPGMGLGMGGSEAGSAGGGAEVAAPAAGPAQEVEQAGPPEAGLPGAAEARAAEARAAEARAAEAGAAKAGAIGSGAVGARDQEGQEGQVGSAEASGEAGVAGPEERGTGGGDVQRARPARTSRVSDREQPVGPSKSSKSSKSSKPSETAGHPARPVGARASGSSTGALAADPHPTNTMDVQPGPHLRVVPDPQADPQADAAGGSEEAAAAAPTEQGLDRLFARIRAGRAEAVAKAREVLEEAPPGEPAETAEAPESDDSAQLVAPSAEALSEASAEASPDVEGDEDEVGERRDDADEALLQRRDATLVAIESALSRRLKRALQDDQNDLLDRVRSLSGRSAKAAKLLDQEDDGRALAGAAEPFLEQAAAAGIAFAGELVDVAAQAPAVAVGDLARDAARTIAEPLRRRLEQALELAADDDQAVVIEAVGSAYREWKSQRLERVAGDALSAAFARGTWDAVPAGTLLRWVAEDVDGPCPDCDDDALAGSIPKPETFPTGQAHPPAHTGCRCLLVPERPAMPE